MAVARLHDLVFDCSHPASLARFWAAVLDGFAVAPYDEAELERLRSNGVDDPEDDPTVLVVGPQGGARLFFQLVPEPKTVKNRTHVDLLCDDLGTEVDRLVALGAKVPTEQPGADVGRVALVDPEGNEFCLSKEA